MRPFCKRYNIRRRSALVHHKIHRKKNPIIRAIQTFSKLKNKIADYTYRGKKNCKLENEINKNSTI